ncbi:9983_t:CDS:2, partial [Ambispora gerdemannii]
VIIAEINEKCNFVRKTDAKIIDLGATRTRADSSEKEIDASFRPKKSGVPAPTGSDGE